MREDHSKNVQADILPTVFHLQHVPLPLLNQSCFFFSSLLGNAYVEESLRQVGNTRVDAIGQ